MAARNLGKRTIIVCQFETGGQGSNYVRGTVQRTVYETSVFAPTMFSCADLPLVKSTYQYIDWCGQRYPVRALAGSDAFQLRLPGNASLASDIDRESFNVAERRYESEVPHSERHYFDERLKEVLARMAS
jgi:hypothetical protein